MSFSGVADFKKKTANRNVIISAAGIAIKIPLSPKNIGNSMMNIAGKIRDLESAMIAEGSGLCMAVK